MRLLDRYLLRELMMPLSYCLCGFIVFWISFDLINELESYQRHQLTTLDIIHYYLWRLPELMVQVAPVALLLALLYALTNHARHHELVAIRAAGVGLWRMALPYFGMGLLFSLAVFYINERLVPDAGENAERILHQHEAGQEGGEQRHWRRNLNFKNDYDNRIWNIAAFHMETGEMLHPQVEWRQADGARRYLIADRAEPAERGWVFYNVTELLYQANKEISRYNTNKLALPDLPETPALIRSEVKVAGLTNVRAAKRAQLSVQEIRNYLQLHGHLSAAEYAKLSTQLHGRLAEPWTSLVVVLIALPFGAAPGRRNVFAGVAASIFICFAYFVLLKFGLALGTGGYLPAWASAWLPNALFAILGLSLTIRLP